MSLLAKLADAILGRPKSRQCVFCMKPCPTSVGQPLPEGWAQPKSYPNLYLYPTGADCLCPSCATQIPIAR